MSKYIFLLIIILSVIFLFSTHIIENYSGIHSHLKNRCANLDFKNCLQKTQCGWLVNNNQSRCLQGTPIGPLNPKLQPDAENSFRKNIQYDRWIFKKEF